MDPTTRFGAAGVAQLYRAFGEREARGVSATYEEWSIAVSEDPVVTDLLVTLPPAKRQPNLVFAAARWHGADGGYTNVRSTLLEQWPQVRATILARATQTNEAGRCAVLLPFLARLPGPLALLEVGAAAGLCLLPDRYSYRYDDGTRPDPDDGTRPDPDDGTRLDPDDGTRLDPDDGASEVVLPCGITAGVDPPTQVPDVVWRAGIDLAPVDVTDDDARAWLRTLVWPEHDDRRTRLHRALDVARRDPPRVVPGDVLDVLPTLAAQAPRDATLVVFHSAVLAYLGADARSAFVEMVTALPGRWISNEGARVLPSTAHLADAAGRRFVVAIDGAPRGYADPHGRSLAGTRG